MDEVKWIKITTNIFDNRKIRQIEKMPDGDAIIVIWLKLLCLAGDVNDNGLVYFTKDIPYTDQLLSNQFARPLSTIQLALHTFECYGMIEIINDVICVSNWEKYQNIEGMERIKEQTRLRVAKYRENKKLKCNVTGSVTGNVTVTQCNGTDIEEEIDIDKERDKEKERDREKENNSDVLFRETVFIRIPLNDKTEYSVTQKDVEMYKALYPAVEVEKQLRNILEWCNKKPQNRKTRSDIKRYIENWLRKEQDRSGNKKYTKAGDYNNTMRSNYDFESLEKEIRENT